mmetsp:Transcript_50545/g.124230  ORF Transcript_50545/g.124230 Transcript_50545/m.124230 type:complete len:97 (-) Transcript_50545:75-365(-)
MVSHVKAFMTADDKESAAKTAQGEASALEDRLGKHAAYYVKVMDNVIAKGTEFVAKELARLKKTLDDGAESLKLSQKHSFQRRIHVLEQFASHEEL